VPPPVQEGRGEEAEPYFSLVAGDGGCHHRCRREEEKKPSHIHLFFSSWLK